MITYFDAELTQISIHKVGNKSMEENLVLSEQPLNIIDKTLTGLLMKYFLHSFEKVNEIYHLSHATGELGLNEVYHFAQQIFENADALHPNSKQIAKHLYDISDHPKIKGGELYFAYFKNLQVEGELHDAIGIFKSESKEPYLTVMQQQREFELDYVEEAINIKKLDKGCIIFNTDKDQGYKVAVVDQTNRSEAVYWIDDFLKLKIRNDNYNQTHATLSIYKSFVTDKIDEVVDITKADKIDLLNKSMTYFKDRDKFDLEEFGAHVLGDPNVIEGFKLFKSNYEEEFDTKIDDGFDISNAAVKKQQRAYKSVLKLDKNFHLYIHGDRELIEKGFDAARNMNFYKVFFREEE